MDISSLKKYNIAVLAGGISSEREISLKSGGSVFKALANSGLKVKFIDVTEKEGYFFNENNFNLAFIAIHGRFGEDGTLQRMLEKENILYTGSGPEASLNAMDKCISKKIFVEQSIKTAPYIVVSSTADTKMAGLKFPVVVKPNFEGSSVGLTIVDREDNLREAVEKALKCGGVAIIETFIPGRELTVGIIDTKPLPVVEIIPSEGVYDYKAKYNSPNTKYIVPAHINDKARKKAQDMAVKAHKALKCEGFSRVDMRLDPEDEIYALEVNTVPGLTDRSLLPMAAKAEGISFEELCVNLLLIAVTNRGKL